MNQENLAQERRMDNIKTIRFDNLHDIELAHIFECGQCFRWNECGDGSYIGVAGGNAAHVVLKHKDDASTLVVECTGGSDEYWRSYFDLDTGYGDMKRTLLAGDSKLDEAIDTCYGIRILNQDYWEVLISFIVSQNNNIPRIKKCIESLARSYGTEIGEFMGEVRYAFPTPEQLAEATLEELAALKLGYRNTYLAAAPEHYKEQGVPTGSAEEKHKALLSYLGVGPKVANCILLFGLRDFTAFPIDVWMKKIMAELYGFDIKDVKGMQKFADEHFGELGGIAQQYLFYFYRSMQ